MQTVTIYQLNATDLKKFFDEELAKKEVDSFLKKFENILVSSEDVAKFHSVNKKTVYAYVKDGLLTPEVRESEKSTILFRLSEALKFDFKELRKQLTIKNRML